MTEKVHDTQKVKVITGAALFQLFKANKLHRSLSKSDLLNVGAPLYPFFTFGSSVGFIFFFFSDCFLNAEIKKNFKKIVS